MIALLLLLSVPAGAKEKLSPTDDAPDDTRKIVRAVDRSSSTIEVQTMFDQAMHHYKIDLGTVVTVDGAMGNLNKIKVGMKVSDFVERDPQTLDSISLVPGDDTPAPAGKKGTASGSK